MDARSFAAERSPRRPYVASSMLDARLSSGSASAIRFVCTSTWKLSQSLAARLGTEPNAATVATPAQFAMSPRGSASGHAYSRHQRRRDWARRGTGASSAARIQEHRGAAVAGHRDVAPSVVVEITAADAVDLETGRVLLHAFEGAVTSSEQELEPRTAQDQILMAVSIEVHDLEVAAANGIVRPFVEGTIAVTEVEAHVEPT